MRSRLNINDIDVGFNDLIPVSVNMAVADVREPEKRNTAYSKTITIPGTKEVNAIFEYAFEVNIESNTFNANLKTPAAYYVNEVRVFNGNLQLLKIIKKYTGVVLEVHYECSIVGETGNFFLDISNLYLTDIDFSDLDHTLTYSSGLFYPTLGTGYCYPYIDYGVDGGNSGNTWYFHKLKPAIFEREYLSRIFSNAGYTWTSSYLDSAYEKSIIIPDVNEGSLKLSTTDILNNQFYASLSSADYSANFNAVHSGSGVWTHPTVNVSPIPFNDDSTGNYYDPGNVYNTTTYIFTQAISGYYELYVRIAFALDFNPPATATTYTAGGMLQLLLEKSTDGGSTWVQAAVSNYNLLTQIGSGAVGAGTNFEGALAVTYPGTYSATPAKWRASFTPVSTITMRYANGGADVTSGSGSVDVNIYENNGATYGSSSFTATLASPDMGYGGNVVMNNTIPTNVKQLDFVTSIIKAENLYVEIDKDDPFNLIIEPREDFITETDPLDWTDKLDVSKDIEILPMGELNFRKFIFTYKNDSDYFNTLYYNEFKEVYGTEKIDVENDFVKGEKQIDLVFSPTPVASWGSTKLVTPRLFKYDGTNASPLKCNIRRLYWGGVIQGDGHFLNINGTSGLQIYSYAFAGMVDDPLAPTVDLGFDNPLKLFYTYPGLTITNNARYNARYSKFIEEITDRDSKIVRAYFYLRERDISEFSFRKIVFVDGSYYFINKISDYDPQVAKPCLVEMLKLKKGSTFSPTNTAEEGNEGGGPQGRQAFNYSGNYGPNTFGSNNINNGTDSVIIGTNNYISGE
jgi:hypothetical protein